jgi:hypothetical protein
LYGISRSEASLMHQSNERPNQGTCEKILQGGGCGINCILFPVFYPSTVRSLQCEMGFFASKMCLFVFGEGAFWGNFTP